MSRETLLTILCVALSIAILVFVVFGCKCTRERFTDGASEASGASSPSEGKAALSSKEQELFNDLMNGNVSDADVKKLIKEGFLSEQLVEKYLDKLDGTTGTTGATEKFTVEKPMKPSAIANYIEKFGADNFQVDDEDEEREMFSTVKVATKSMPSTSDATPPSDMGAEAFADYAGYAKF